MPAHHADADDDDDGDGGVSRGNKNGEMSFKGEELRG